MLNLNKIWVCVINVDDAVLIINLLVITLCPIPIILTVLLILLGAMKNFGMYTFILDDSDIHVSGSKII